MLSHEDVRAAASARLDGEDYALADDVLDAHLAGCAECAAFVDNAVALHRTLRGESVREGMAPPQDLADVILAGVEPEWRAAAASRQAQLSVARVLLVTIGAALVVWAIAQVVGAARLTDVVGYGPAGTVLSPDSEPERAALMIEGAALRLGLASGLFFVAWRPASAPGLLPMVTTMLMFLAGFAMRDIAMGTLGMERVYTLLALLVAVAALGWTWASDRGFAPRMWWRQLNAEPV